MQLDDISVIKASIKWIMFIATNIFLRVTNLKWDFQN